MMQPKTLKDCFNNECTLAFIKYYLTSQKTLDITNCTGNNGVEMDVNLWGPVSHKRIVFDRFCRGK